MKDHEFKVARERLSRKDGKDTMYDALYREDNGIQLAVVGRNYQLVTHKQAVSFLDATLEESAIEAEVFRSDLTNNGSRFMHEVRLPGYRFDVPGDNGHEPTIKMWNSLNRTKSFSLDFGTWRQVCTNGLSVGVQLFHISEIHSRDRIQLRTIGGELIKSIESVIVNVRKRYKELAQLGAKKFIVRMLKDFPVLFLGFAAAQLQDSYDFTYETVGGLPKPVSVKEVKAISALALLQVLTNVATHHVESAIKRQRIDRNISALMGI